MAKNNPWLALSTYEEKDKDKFKGREQDTQNMLKMLQQNEYVICYAASGDGNSSLINAGVCPEMKKIGYYPIKIVFSSDEYERINIPQKEDNKIDFDACILKKIEESTSQVNFEVEERFISLPSSLSSILWWKLRTQTIQVPFGEFDYIPVLIFDQFEEILRAKWKNEFFAWLEEFSSDECPESIYNSISNYEKIPSQKKFKAIFSMRYEYVGELDYWCSQRYFIPQMMRGRYFLKPFTRKQALEIITNQELPQTLEEKFRHEATNILDNIIRDSANSLGNDEVPAVVLSLVCHILFEKWSFDLDFLIDNTGINSVIHEYYMEEIKAIGIPDKERRQIENTLISAEGNRLRIHILDSRLTSIGFNTYIDKSANKNLLSAHIVKMNDEYVEFTHDRLAESILINRKEEDRKINKISTYSKIRTGGVIFIFSFLILSCFYFAQDFKSDSLYGDEVKKQIVEYKDSVLPLPIVINDINDDLNGYDWFNATSVEFSQNIHPCPCKEYCYGNVIVKNREIRYASNADKLVFNPRINTNVLQLNKNVNDLYLFRPESLEFISLYNPYTIVHVPYGTTKACLSNDAFKDVHFVEMSLFETLYERAKYEFSYQHIHPFGIKDFTIYSYFAGVVFFLGLLIWIIISRIGNMTKRSIVLLILTYVSIAAISTFLYLELYWLKILSGGFNIGYPIIFIILLEIIRFICDKKYNLYKDKAEVCIVYYSNEGKQFAQKLRNGLISHTRFTDSDILLNMTILHHGKFNEDVFLNNITSTKKVIAIITDLDLYNDDDNRYFSLLGKCKYLLPVIVSKDETAIQKVKNLLLEYKDRTYPTISSERNFNIDLLSRIANLLVLSPSFEKKFSRWLLILTVIFGIFCAIVGNDAWSIFVIICYCLCYFELEIYYINIIKKIGMDDHIHYKPLLLRNILLLLIGCYIGVQIGKIKDDIFAGIIRTTIIQMFFNSLFIVGFYVAKRRFYKKHQPSDDKV